MVVGFLARVEPVDEALVFLLAVVIVVVDFASALNRLCRVVTVDDVALLVEIAVLTASDWACGVDTVMSAATLASYGWRVVYASMLLYSMHALWVCKSRAYHLLPVAQCLGGVTLPTSARINK